MQAKYTGNTRVNILLSPRPSGAQPTTIKEMPKKVVQESPCTANGTGAPISGSAPAAK